MVGSSPIRSPASLRGTPLALNTIGSEVTSDVGLSSCLLRRVGSAGLVASDCVRMKVNKWFLFNYLGEADVVQLIAGRAHGVTLPNLNAGLMASVPVLLPPRALQDRFGSDAIHGPTH